MFDVSGIVSVARRNKVKLVVSINLGCDMAGQVFSALLAVVLGVGFCWFYFAGCNYLLDSSLIKQRMGTRGESLAEKARPWVFVLPALAILFTYLIFPVFATLRLSLFNASGVDFVGLANYIWAFRDPEFLQAIFNNIQWLIVVPLASTVFGLVIAAIADRVWWGTIAKTMIFMPMAISFVGASVIWKFVYDYRGPDTEQIGILNALVVAMGGEPQAWITLPFWNGFFLMAILVWIQTGFAMVILSAALRSVPEDTLEAARIDAAGELAIFLKIVLPQVMPTILVVWTTITIVVLKIFDIVLAMTNGQWDTEVLANLMFDWMFRGGGDFGRGSAIAVVLMLAVVPIIIMNIRRFNRDGGL